MHIYGVDSADFSLTSGTAKTAWQWVTGSTRRSMLLEIGFSGASVTSSDVPVLIELRLQSTAGTSSAFTPTLTDQGDPAAISTARNAFTAEPTDVSLLIPGPWRVTPIGGLFVYDWKKTLEIEMAVSTRIGCRCTSGSSLASCRSYGLFQE